MAEPYELQIKVKVDKDLKNLEITDTKLKTFTEKIEKTTETTQKGTAGFGKMDGGLKSLASGLGINIVRFTSVAAIIGTVVAVVKTGITQWEEQLVINRKLESTVKGIGLSYDKLKDSIDSQLDSLTANKIGRAHV